MTGVPSADLLFGRQHPFNNVCSPILDHKLRPQEAVRRFFQNAHSSRQKCFHYGVKLPEEVILHVKYGVLKTPLLLSASL